MSAAKHTPGPWRASLRANYTTPGWVILWPDTSKHGIHHRRLDSNGGFVEADARLIADAPDLLDIAQRLAALADGLDNGNSAAEEAAARLAVAARAIVARATGGAA